MNKFFMMIGLPGSGKSTKTQELSKEYSAIIHASDKIREELFGTMDTQDGNDLVFQTLHKRVKSDLREGKNVIYDACNINYRRRMAFLREIQKINCEKIAVFIATPYRDCIEYNQLRNRKVPEEVVTRMYKNFYISQYYEGWDDIQIIWNYKEDNFDIIKLFDELDKIDQETPYHTLTIGKHCDKCGFHLAPLIEDKETVEYFTLLAIAKLHDIGKIFCKEYNEEKGHYTYYQHHLVGAYNAMFYLKTIGYTDKEIIKMCNYIQWHMQPFFIRTEEAKNKFIKLVGQEFYDNLMILHEADKMAK